MFMERLSSHCWRKGLRVVDNPILPASVPGGWTIHEIMIAGRTFRLRGPAEPDRFLDLLHELDSSDACPYWAALWPTSNQMAQFILDRDWRGHERSSWVAAWGLSASLPWQLD